VTPFDNRPIPAECLQRTFLNTSVRYSESLNYAIDVRTHSAGYTREFPSHRRAKNDELLESWTCYRDGLVAYEWRLTQDTESKPLLNLNAAAYNITRVLQLADEVFDPASPEIEAYLDLSEPTGLVLPVFAYSQISRLATYVGYHEPIRRRFDRAEISGRDKWNVICPPVQELLEELARAFGFAELPQAYWDDRGVLDYSKIGSRG